MQSSGDWYQITCGYGGISCSEYNNWYKRAVCQVQLITSRSAFQIEEECRENEVREFNKVEGQCVPIGHVKWSCEFIKTQNLGNLKTLQSWKNECEEGRVQSDCFVYQGSLNGDFCNEIMNLF